MKHRHLIGVISSIASLTLLWGAMARADAPPAEPKQVAVHSDAAIKNGPRYILSGTADHQQNAWFGTEEQGVFLYSNGGWKQFSTTEGLGDDTVTAMACDALGRIWAGQLAHGFSIYNGKEWKNYIRLCGSGGSHVFAIKTCPTDGDVWIATEAGLTRYSLKKDSFTYYNRSQGMPDEQASSLAFDSKGNLYAGLAANGVAVAHAADGYSHWTQTKGPNATPIQPTGGGLPSSLVNAMLVTRDDTVYAGTTRGLACSTDGGTTWAYVRGKNWPLLAEGRYEGMPDDFDFASRGALAEDWITSLAEDSFGVIWIGYQNAGYQTFFPGANTPDHELTKRMVTTIVPVGAGRCILGTSAAGVLESAVEYTGSTVSVTPPASALAADAFPTIPAAPDAAVLDAIRKQIESLPAAPNGIEFLPDDWETGGDWIGTHGTDFADLTGYKSFFNGPGYGFSLTTGPYRKAYMRYYWDDRVKIDQTRFLFDPNKKIRLYCENNDESYDTKTHPRAQEGPDIFLRFTMPAGVHVVTLFFHNYDGHGGGGANAGINGQRDFVLQVRDPNKVTAAEDADDSDNQGGYNANQISPIESVDAELAPTVMQTRISSFYAGVYKRMLIRGAGTYWMKIDRNHSPCAKVSAVLIDRLDVPGKAGKPWYAAAFKASTGADYTTDAGLKGAAARLWAAVDAASGRAGYAALADQARVMAYRAAAADGADEETLSVWRQKMLLWTEPDRDRFDQAAGMAAPPPTGL